MILIQTYESIYILQLVNPGFKFTELIMVQSGEKILY